MTSYNEHACRQLYEKHGENLGSYLTKKWGQATVDHWKHLYSKNLWTGNMFSESPLTMIINGVTNTILGVTAATGFLVAMALGPVWVPIYQAYKYVKSYKAFQAFLEEKSDDK